MIYVIICNIIYIIILHVCVCVCVYLFWLRDVNIQRAGFGDIFYILSGDKIQRSLNWAISKCNSNNYFPEVGPESFPYLSHFDQISAVWIPKGRGSFAQKMLNKISVTLKGKKMCVYLSLNSKFLSFLVSDRSLSSRLGQKDSLKPRFDKVQNQGSRK